MLLDIMSKDKNSVQTTTRAAEALDAVCGRSGMTKKLLVERIFVWLSEQPEEVQALVIGQAPRSIAPDVARMILTRLSASDPSPDVQAARLAQAARDAAQKAGPSVAPVPAPRKSPRSSGGGSVN